MSKERKIEKETEFESNQGKKLPKINRPNFN